MTTSIPEQYQSLKTKLETIVKKIIIQYELSSSDYNPTIDSTITITCTCKNVLGNPIANKTLELMMNGVSQGTSTTNANGIATWTVTLGAWGNKHFYIGNATLDLVVTGYREISVTTGKLYVNDLTKTASYYFTRTGSITSEISYANVIPSTYKPYSYVRMKAHNTQSVFLTIESGGTVKINGTSSSSITISTWITYTYGL